MSLPVAPVEAATVVLVRVAPDVGDPWQCFMLRRHVHSEFAADVYVFPGGKVDEADRDPVLARFCEGHPAPIESTDPETWRALRFCAIRELFEEAGVLLAHHPDAGILRLDGSDADRFAGYRDEIHSGFMTLLDLANLEYLRFPLDRLHPLSRWITPEQFQRRFDTHFFVSYMPEGQKPVHDALETTAGTWIAPAEALRRDREGSFPLVFATQKHLERMARYPSIDGLIAATSAADLTPVMPRMVQENGETRFLIPGDDGY